MSNKTLLSSAESGLWNELKQQYSIVERNDIVEKIQVALEEWKTKVSRHLDVENPYWEDYETIKRAEADLQQGNFALEAIENDLSDLNLFMQKTNSTMEEFWNKKLMELKKSHASLPKKRTAKKKITDEFINQQRQQQQNEQAGLRGSLQKEWRDKLEAAHSHWELQQLNGYRRKIFEQLKSWLDLLQELYSFFNQLSIEPGLLFDLSEGQLTNTDIEVLKRWMTYISENEGVKKLCDMLGRLRQAEQSHREEIIKFKKKITIEVPDSNSVEEIIGITLGKDIENAIPEELALLADEESALLFDLKFIENRLMCFETQGLQQTETEIEARKKVEVSEDEEMGPIIVCVDTSGSMQGYPEAVAKAVTLYMATRAASQNRNCYLINFSTSIETIDLSNKIGLAETMKFLQQSFHGGTDVAPALEHALATVRDENYKQADILTISDFVMGDISSDLNKKISDVKKNKNKFYSLCVGENFMDKKLATIFDKEWIYDPNNMNIQEVHKFVQVIA